MAFLDSSNVEDLVADIKALADQTYITDSELDTATKRNVFTVKGTLKSNITSSGNIFTQSTASDSRITSSTEVANVIFDSTVNITSDSVTVTPGSGTVTITGKTSSFSGTVNVVIELFNI